MKSIQRTWTWILTIVTLASVWVGANYSWKGGAVYIGLGAIALIVVLNWNKFKNAI